jgi:tripartite-type tricarboxylate transporter receptor subunit TctC
VATIGESVPGYGVPDTWFGFMGPAGLPRPIVEKLNAEIRRAVQDPEVRQRIENIGMEPTGIATADQMATSLKAEVESIRKIVTTAGIQPE